MHTKKELDERLLAAGVRPLKNLGQNFLVNPRICSEIVAAVEKFSPQSVVEIGPGLGALTDELIARSSEKSFKIWLIEIDSGLVEYWKKNGVAANPQCTILHEDALKVNWKNLALPGPAVLVSNLPYSIAASLVVDMSDPGQESIPFDVLILMFQKEVAQRITSQPGDEDYGMLSVMAQVHWKIDRLIDAGPQDFYPVPNVGSRVLLFTRRNQGDAPAELLAFVKLAFSQRRKKLVSNLSSIYKKEAIPQALADVGHGPDVRAQELSPRQFVDLFSLLESKKR